MWILERTAVLQMSLDERAVLAWNGDSLKGSV